MRKRLYVYLGVVAFMVVLIIFSAIYESNYRVYLIQEVAEIFEQDTQTSDSFGQQETVIPPEATHSIDIDGSTIALTYNETLSNEMYAYTSADSRVNCWYDKHSGRIRLISAENWQSAQALDSTEEAYLNWIYSQVALHSTENWNEYRKTCTTTLISSASGSPQQIQQDGFILPGENETAFVYAFTFTKILGEFETSDVIQAYIYPGSGFAALGFSAHHFDNTSTPDVNMSRFSAAVKRFVKHSLDTKKYTYIRHEFSQPKFTYINSTLCLICTVSVEVQTENGTKTVDQQLAVIVR